MLSTMKNLLVLVFVVIFTVKAGKHIQCYSCQSTSDPSCEDPTQILKTIECSPPASSCLTTHILEADGSKTTERSCTEARLDPCGLTSKVMEYLNGKLLSCDVCDQDLCNGFKEHRTDN